MFDTSILLLLKALLINIFLPIIPGIIFIWIFFGKKFSGFSLYLYSWFLWIWVIAFSLFNIQFVHYWVWINEYLFFVILLIISLLIKNLILKQNIFNYFALLKIKFELKKIKEYYSSLPKTQKYFSLLFSLFIFSFIVISFLFNINFPSYADDSFWNWNMASINIYHDGWIKLFWDKIEILWRWRLWYPIFFPIYKSIFSSFLWIWNDIYIKLFQWMIFFFGMIFIIKITLQKTKNIFYSLIPVVLIIWLPLTFFHSVESYMEMSSTIYSIITIYFLYEFILTKDYEILSLWILYWLILANIKNEGLVVYLSWILLAFLVFLILTKTLKSVLLEFFKNKVIFIKNIFFVLYFFIPFLIVRFVNNLSLNPVWNNAAEIWISSKLHTEIFPIFPTIFFGMDNYNVILIWIGVLIYLLFKNIKKININNIWPIFPWFFIFIIFFFVFLLTENYEFVLNQTTVNRVFTTSFIIIAAFYWLILHYFNEK